MRVDIVHISDNDKQFGSAIDEYIKRLGSMVTVHTLKPIKYVSPQQIIAQETVLLKEKIESVTDKQEIFCCLLTHRGASLPSHNFATMVQKHGRVLFVIGGAFGVEEDQLESVIHKKISFGHQTMPHGLVKLVLFEQIRRAHTIAINKKYHY